MGILNAITKNTITFTRISNDACIGYKIIAEEVINGEIKEYLLAEIQNPKAPMPVNERAELEYNQDCKWDLPKDVLGTGSDSVKVWVNNVEIDTGQYTFSPKLRVLYIDCKLAPNDLIQIEYSVDRISYTHNTQNVCTYKVTPVFKNTHTIGQHTVL